MIEKYKKSFGSLEVTAGWDGEDFPPIMEITEPGFLRIVETQTQRVVHEQTDLLSRRIAWLLQHAEMYPEKINEWNCFCTVRLATGNIRRMVFQLLVKKRGTPTDDMMKVATEQNEPFVFDWIGFRRSTKNIGPTHTGIILGIDNEKNDLLAFEKDGKFAPVIRYWKDIVQEQKPETEGMMWAPFSAIEREDIEPEPSDDDYSDWMM